MEIVRYHPKEGGMELAGNPEWWTVRIRGREWDCVRVDYTLLDPRLLLFVFLPKRAYAWPALVAPTFRLGEAAFTAVRDLGGRDSAAP